MAELSTKYLGDLQKPFDTEAVSSKPVLVLREAVSQATLEGSKTSFALY